MVKNGRAHSEHKIASLTQNSAVTDASAQITLKCQIVKNLPTPHQLWCSINTSEA